MFAGDGFYAHIQMMSGTAAQITEFIPPHRMFRNVWEFWVGVLHPGMIMIGGDGRYVGWDAVHVFAPIAVRFSAC